MTPRAGLAGLAALVVAAGAGSVFRAGYSPDEEFTVFAVRGIGAHGLPVLPSGLLYDRGLLYSYLAWLASSASGLELPAFRTISLLSAAAALALGYTLLRRVSTAAAVASTALVASAAPFWAVATTGRFYAPFLLIYVAVLTGVTKVTKAAKDTKGTGVTKLTKETKHTKEVEGPKNGWGAPGERLPAIVLLFTLAFLARLTHELAFTLMAIPALGVFLALTASPQALKTSRPQDLKTESRNARSGSILSHEAHENQDHQIASLRLWLRVLAAMGAGLVAAQVLLMALHYVMPRSAGSTMIERFFLWQVLNLFERPAGAPLGVIGAALVVAWLLVPSRAVFSLTIAARLAAGAMAIAIAWAALTATPSTAILRNVVAGSLHYPLDMFWHLVRHTPLMAGAALVLLVARLAGAGGEWPIHERAAHLGWVGWVLWFGVIESGITINYLLLPTVFMLAAIGLDLVAIGRHTAAIWPGRRAQVMRAALAGAGLAVAASQWAGDGPVGQRLAAVRPTIAIAGLDELRASLRPSDLVACTDELACLLLVGRVDAWLALDDYVRERFVVMRDSTPVGVYAGAPAVFSPQMAQRMEEAGGSSPRRVIVVDVFKDFAVGNSATWLPRALEADGLAFRTLLLTPQARVGQVLKLSE